MVVAVMAELKGNMKIRAIPHVVWCTLPFNKSFSNLISVRMIMQKLYILLSNFVDRFTFTVTEMLWLLFPKLLLSVH